jgi:tetratricopeptide (TPR) repeat protein
LSSRSRTPGNERAEPAAPGRRGWIAAALATTVLLAVCAAKWDGFAYAHYLAAVIFQCGALVSLLVWAWPRRLPVGSWRALQPAACLFCAYAAYSLASSLWAPELRLSVIGSLPMFFGVTWALALGHLLSGRRQARLILRGMFAAGTVAALAGFLYVLLSGEGKWIDQVHGIKELFHTLWQRGYLLESVDGHRNFLATFLLPPLVMGLADLLTPLLTRPAQRGATLGLPRTVLWLCLLLTLGVFVLCQSWGALLGLGVGLTCVFAARLSSRARWRLVGGLVGMAVAAFICLSLPRVQAKLMQSHQATRWFMWQGAARMILDRPIFGWGSGMFVLRFADYKPTRAMEFGWLENITIYPHNELLLVAAEGGFIALGLYLAAHFLAARGHLRKAQAEDAPLRIAAWAVFGGFLAMFTHGLVEVSLRFWAPAAAYWTLLGVMIASGRSEAPVSVGARVGGRADAWALLGSVLVMVIAVALGVVYSGARAERFLRSALSGRRMDLEDRIHHLSEATRFSRYVPDYLIALKWRGGLEWRSGNEAAAIRTYEELERVAPGVDPGKSSVRAILANLYRDQARKVSPWDRQAATADLRKARKWIALAVRQNPYDVEWRLLYADLLVEGPEPDPPAAIDELRAAVKLAPNSVEPRISLAALLARSGHKQEALAMLDEAASLCPPGNPSAAQIAKLRSQIAKP